MTALAHLSDENSLLAALPRRDQRRLRERGEVVGIARADALCAPGERISHVYFPLRGFISLVMPVKAAASIEVGLVGNEGMFGLSVVLGVDRLPLHAVVQGAGAALRIPAPQFARALERSLALRAGMHRYACVHMVQLAQSAACTRFHVVESRLARWLLMTQDRADSDAFHVTQAFLAAMLGVRRVGVTKAASELQRRGLIRYRRGDLVVTDRRGLEDASCACYEADRTTYRRIMGAAGAPEGTSSPFVDTSPAEHAPGAPRSEHETGNGDRLRMGAVRASSTTARLEAPSVARGGDEPRLAAIALRDRGAGMCGSVPTRPGDKG